MDSFSISELAQYSGIKSHTIRIWEKRYDALRPDRSAGNTRHYNAKQLKRLLNISSLLDTDYKVSELCAMPDEKLKALHASRFNTAIPVQEEYFVSQLISAALTFDELQFVHVFSHCVLRYGLKDTYMLVLYPALNRIGLLWLSDSLPTANEHFISNLIRQKIFTGIDALPPAKPDSPSWILFLPENEFHEIGLLMAYYLIRLSGQKVIYLGGNVPESSILATVRDLKPDNVLTFMVRNDFPSDVKKYVGRLSTELKVKRLYVAAKPELAHMLPSGKKLQVLTSVWALDNLLQNHIV